MSLRVRRATLADVDALTPLFDGYRQFYGQPGNPLRAHDFDQFSQSCSILMPALLFKISKFVSGRCFVMSFRFFWLKT